MSTCANPSPVASGSPGTPARARYIQRQPMDHGSETIHGPRASGAAVELVASAADDWVRGECRAPNGVSPRMAGSGCGRGGRAAVRGDARGAACAHISVRSLVVAHRRGVLDGVDLVRSRPRIRLVADGGGVDVVNVFTRRRYAWSDIDRFDVSSWSGYPIVVTMTGARHRISSQRLSPAERFLELPQPDTRSSRRTESSPGTAQSCRLRLIPKRRAGTSAHPRHIQEETVHHHSSRR
jgi:hypothetical protein